MLTMSPTRSLFLANTAGAPLENAEALNQGSELAYDSLEERGRLALPQHPPSSKRMTKKTTLVRRLFCFRYGGSNGGIESFDGFMRLSFNEGTNERPFASQITSIPDPEVVLSRTP